MDFIQFRHQYSQHTLVLIILTALAASGVLVWQYEFIADVYFRDQLTMTGIVINGAIFALFLGGMTKIAITLLFYSREEKALSQFINNLGEKRQNLQHGIDDSRIIARRLKLMMQLHEQKAPINQGALAATLLASESVKTTLPKFINNVLILTGVFGTIVSLSIALVGASDMLASIVDANGMGTVIHGMSTALSTTITAILCYLFFGYFYLKLLDVQTNTISAVEQITSGALIPRFHVQTDTVLYEFSGLVRSLQSLVDQMSATQAGFAQVEERLANSLEDRAESISGVTNSMDAIQTLLRQGFRLDH